MSDLGQRTASATRIPRWEPGRLKSLVSRLAFPVFYMLNRPSMRWFGQAAFDFALRCNGFAINFGGQNGLTVGEEKFLRKVLSGKTEAVFLDVGANGGSYTRMLRKLVPNATIYAFEPHPVTFGHLQRNVDGPGTTLINQALSEKPGKLVLYDFADRDGSTQASLSRDAVVLFSDNVLEHAVSVTTVDQVVADHRIDYIDLLKIDTEGFDLSVLKGARQALADRRIGVIQFEFIPANVATRTFLHDFLELLSDYTLHRLCLNGDLIPLQPYDVKRVEVFVTHNLVAIPILSPNPKS